MKKALSLLLVLCCLTIPARAADFYDLTADHWAAEPIRRAVEAGAVNGYGDGSFQPGRNVTAAQFCAMLSRTFLKEAFAAAPEGKHQAMDACLPVLKGTGVEAAYKAAWRRWSTFVDEPLSRYDMAQIIGNLLGEREALPREDDMLAARAKIADWDDIPANYRSAVSACWAGGILQGRSDGRFAGAESLNRAQSCVIWSRLDSLFGGGQDEEEPAPEGVVVEMPAFGLREDETVQQMMNRINAATPRSAEGYLSNGKQRTEENTRELLELVKEGCPDGTVWSGTIRYDYKAPSLGPAKGCLSFGMAVSDFLFGEEAPVTQHRNFRALAAGDVIHIQGGGAERVLILTGVDREEDIYTACELRKEGKVKWSEWGPISGLIDKFGFTTVYSRW